MYKHCLFCARDLGANEVVEAFPIGTRLAFDPERGRLWVVCSHCERWNLTPLEERWEGLEQCERTFRSLKTRVSTREIGLAKHPSGLTLIRIGAPQRPEFAAWRYGDQFGRRRTKLLWTLGAGVAVGGAVAAGGWAVGVASGALLQGSWVLGQAVLAARGMRTLVHYRTDSGDEGRLTPQDVRWLKLATSDAGLEILDFPGGSRGPDTITGKEAERVAGVVLPWMNRGGAGKRTVQSAVSRIEQAGHPEEFVKRAIRSHPPKSLLYADKRRMAAPGGGVAMLAKLPTPTRLALEMALHEEQERRALHGELAQLEYAWREAETLAAIEDDLLLPEGTEARLEDLRGQQERG